MEWLVISDREGNMIVMTRVLRECLLEYWFQNGVVPMGHVTKVCKSKLEAHQYISDIKFVNRLIDNL